MSEPTKAEQWLEEHFPLVLSPSTRLLVTRAYVAGHVEGYGVGAVDGYTKGQAEAEAGVSYPASPTLLDIARRLRDEFPGTYSNLNIEIWARKDRGIGCSMGIRSTETEHLSDCTSLESAIARLRQARDGDADPADLPGADMRIDLTAETA